LNILDETKDVYFFVPLAFSLTFFGSHNFPNVNNANFVKNMEKTKSNLKISNKL